MNCPTCAMPMVWSQDREVMWCSVYGRHPEQFRNVADIAHVIPIDRSEARRRKSRAS